MFEADNIYYSNVDDSIYNPIMLWITSNFFGLRSIWPNEKLPKVSITLHLFLIAKVQPSSIGCYVLWQKHLSN